MRKTEWLWALLAVSCGAPPVPVIDAGADASVEDAGTDAGTPPTFRWKKVAETFPSRSNHVAFYWPGAQRTLVFSGNHVTAPIHDAWDWDGTAWAQRSLAPSTYPERKNPGVAVDTAGGRVFVFGGVWSGYPTAGGPHVVRVLGDLQMWNGEWSAPTFSDGPSPRAGLAMTWDDARHEAVLFGGTDNATAFGDTWTFDGTAWRERATDTAPRPPPRINAKMAYDPRRQRVVLFGGQAISDTGDPINLDDTWEWDGTGWTRRVSAGPGPAGRGHHLFEFDPLRERVMLFGGARHFSPLPPDSTLADQWEWDGASWARVEPAGARPPRRNAGSLNFDPVRRVMVLIGGYDRFDLNDVWEWNGTGWVEKTTLPVPRSDFGFAQAGPGQPALLFGGYLSGGARYLNDTWRHEGGRWSRVEGTAPPERSGAALAMHGRDAIVLGGIHGSSMSFRSDMWRLNDGATSWTPVTGLLPPMRRDASIAYDPHRRITVLFGGRSSTVLQDTWLWNGTGWTRLDPPTSPPARESAALVFDPISRRLVVLGGLGADRKALGDAWAFDGTTWARLDLPAAPSLRVDSAVAFDSFGRLVQWGGRLGPTALDDVGVYSDGQWWPVPTGPSARFDAAWVNHGNRWMTVFGSQSDFQTRWEDLTDVWELGPGP